MAILILFVVSMALASLGYFIGLHYETTTPTQIPDTPAKKLTLGVRIVGVVGVIALCFVIAVLAMKQLGLAGAGRRNNGVFVMTTMIPFGIGFACGRSKSKSGAHRPM
jgi:hypothetical protein